MLADLDTPLDHVVALEAARDVLLERMKKRAEIEGDALTTLRRPSPSASTTYEKETAPLLGIYEGVACSSTFNGVGSIDEISGHHHQLNSAEIGKIAWALGRSDAEDKTSTLKYHKSTRRVLRHAERAVIVFSC